MKTSKPVTFYKLPVSYRAPNTQLPLLCNVDYCLLLMPHLADMAVVAKCSYIALEFLDAILILLYNLVEHMNDFTS